MNDPGHHDETERRLRAALAAEADATRPTDGWAAITARLDRRAGPTTWLRERPGFLGAVAALILVLGVVAVARLGDADDPTQIDAVGPDGTDLPGPPGADAGPGGGGVGPVVAARPDGSLALLDPATGAVARELVVDADFPDEARVGDRPMARTELLAEAGAAPGGDVVYQTRPEADTETCVSEEEHPVRADWTLWSVPISGGGPTPTFADGRPGRLPAPSPDGSRLAYVTTSDGTERCDGALTVAVADLATGEVLATHTLPVGVEPLQLIWPSPDGLVIALPEMQEGGGVQARLVATDPSVSGPLDLGQIGGSFSALLRIAPAWAVDGSGHRPLVVTLPDDGSGFVAVGQLGPEAGTPPPELLDRFVDLPVPTRLGAVLTVAQDSAGTVWVTATFGEIEFPVAPTSDVRTYRLPVGETEATQVSDAFVAVTASPFGGEVSAPGADDAPPSTGAGPGPTAAGADPDAGDGAPAVIYATTAGALVTRSVDGEPAVVAQLDPQAGVPDLAVAPSGQTAYLAFSDGVDPCGSSLFQVDLTARHLGLLPVAEGTAPAVSPDGTRLAYLVHQAAEGTAGCGTHLVVRDLATGDERRWRDPTSFGEDRAYPRTHRLASVGWADDTTLVLAATFEADELFTADTGGAGDDLALTPFDPGAPPAGAGASWYWVLSDTAEVDGGPAVVLYGDCHPMEPCEAGPLLRFVALDGGVIGDQATSGLWNSHQVGPHGILARGRQDGRLWWRPVGETTEREIAPTGVTAAAWLP